VAVTSNTTIDRRWLL